MDSERPSFDDLLQRVTQLPNGELTQQLRQLNDQKCARDAELLLYLSELDERGLYRQEAVSSLFEFCVSRLGCSEDVAWKRVGVARLMRRFPLVFELLCSGRIHLSALMLVKPHLTAENHREWLLAASGKSKRQVEKLVASRCPKPDVATSVRKLPEARPLQGSVPVSVSGSVPVSVSGSVPVSVSGSVPVSVSGSVPVSVSGSVPVSVSASVPASVSGSVPVSVSDSVPVSRIAPLSGSSYRVTFTASERWKQKLEHARELASHVISPSDLPALLERALDLLIEREERRRCAFGIKSRATAKHHQTTESPVDTEGHDFERHTDAEHHADAECPADAKQQSCQMRDIGEAKAQDPGRLGASNAGDRTLQEAATDGPMQPTKPRSRHVPAAVRREIWRRDEGRCTFTDAQGNRCEERCFLEIEHLQPFAVDGATSVSNCTLRCRSHNILAAELSFGRRHIDSAIARARERRRSGESGTREHRSDAPHPPVFLPRISPDCSS